MTYYKKMSKPMKSGKVLKIIKDFFKQHPHIREAITFNSKVYLITEYLEKINLRYKIYRI